MEAANIAALIGTGVAIATSVGSLAVSLHVARADRPHLKLKATFAVAPAAADLAEYVCVTVSNDGRYREVVEGFGFRVDDGRKMELALSRWVVGTLPRSLDIGESLLALIPRAELANQIRSDLLTLVGLYANASSGREYSAALSQPLRDGLRRLD